MLQYSYFFNYFYLNLPSFLNWNYEQSGFLPKEPFFSVYIENNLVSNIEGGKSPKNPGRRKRAKRVPDLGQAGARNRRKQRRRRRGSHTKTAHFLMSLGVHAEKPSPLIKRNIFYRRYLFVRLLLGQVGGGISKNCLFRPFPPIVPACRRYSYWRAIAGVVGRPPAGDCTVEVEFWSFFEMRTEKDDGEGDGAVFSGTRTKSRFRNCACDGL